MKKFYPEIDWLKAFGAFLVIFIHVIARYKGLSRVNFLAWDLAHFGVGAFVLAAGFLQANSPLKDHDLASVWKWFKKRFVRVVVPYYIFAPVYVLAAMVVSSPGKILAKIDLDYVLDTLLLSGGVGNNWIPRLFFWLAVAFVTLELIRPYIKRIYKWAFGLSLIYSTYLLWGNFSLFGKNTNVVGWLVIYLTGYFLYFVYEKKKDISIKWSMKALWGTIMAYLFLAGIGASTVIFGNKYPPNLYFVMYNIFASLLMLYLFRHLVNWDRLWKWLQKGMSYLAKASYDLFFYHLVVMKLLSGYKLGVWVDYLWVMVATIAFIVVKREVFKIKI